MVEETYPQFDFLIQQEKSYGTPDFSDSGTDSGALAQAVQETVERNLSSLAGPPSIPTTSFLNDKTVAKDFRRRYEGVHLIPPPRDEGQDLETSTA